MHFFPSTLLITQDHSFTNPFIQKCLALHGQDKIQNNYDLVVFGDQTLVSIDHIRDLNNFTTTTPISHPKKTILIFHAELLNPTVQNSLLKLLEEPPSFLTIILVSTTKQSLLPTVLSRCQVFEDILNSSHYQTIFPQNETKLPALLSFSDTLFPKTPPETPEEKRSRIRQLLLQELSYYQQQLVQNPSPTLLKQVKNIHKGILMVKQNVDPKAVIDYILLQKI